MTYIELLQALEQRLGNQHLPLNPRATTMKQIFEGSPVHHELMRQLVDAIYIANGCRQLGDAVDKDKTFAAIGPLRRDTLQRPTADVDVYRLLDDVCHALDRCFADGAAANAPEKTKSAPADVIPLDAARRRK
jgi:hypothetical protein